jgi:phage FluMu protein Com
MANYPSFITLTTRQQGQQDFIPNSDSTPITTPVNRLSLRQLHFHADRTKSTLELPSEINNAICLSYNCNQWHAESDDNAKLEVSVPKCKQCEELKEENRRLKTTIEELQSEKANSTSMFFI